MSAQHTPGPWHVIDGGNHWNNPAITNYRIHAASGERGFDVAWSEAGELVVEHVYEEANARLIAAAPTLLAEHDVRVGDLVMLRKAIEAGDPKPELLFRIDDMLRDTRAAIAKAAGGQA